MQAQQRDTGKDSGGRSSALRILVTVGSTTFSTLIRYILSPQFTSVLPRGTTLNVQYGRSDLVDILTTTSLVDAGSEFHPEPGLRKDPQRGTYTWRGSDVHSSLDPGLTGQIVGWKVGPLPGQESDKSTFTQRLTFHLPEPSNVTLNLFDFTDALAGYMRNADVVVSHAGSGSLLEALRMDSPPLVILVPNTTLMDNHQLELAQAIEHGNWAWRASVDGEDTDADLAAVLAQVLQVWQQPSQSTRPAPFPEPQPQRFKAIVDGMLGI